MKKIFKNEFINSLLVLAYIALVAIIMQNGDMIFGAVDNYLGPVAFLLLFTLSAIVVGGLVLGRPLMLYLDGQKKEAVKSFTTTALWIAGFAIVALAVAVIL